MFSNIFYQNVNKKEVFLIGDRVVCVVSGPHRPEKERCGVVAMTNATRKNLTDVVVVALDNPLMKKTDQRSRKIAEELMIAAEQVLVVEEKNKDKVIRKAAHNNNKNDQDHALFCCKSCERIACKIDLIDFSGNLVCKSHFCPWDSVNHGPNVQEVAELYCRMLDIAERARLQVHNAEAKALMYHGSFVELLAKARNREADAGQDLLRFFFYLLQPSQTDFFAKLPMAPNNRTVTKKWNFEFLQGVLVGEDFLPYFRSLGKLIDLTTNSSPLRVASPAVLRLNVICLDSANPDKVSIELRAGSKFPALWNGLTSLNSLFRRQEFEVFVERGNGLLLYDQQHFCLPLEERQANKGDTVYRLGMNSLADEDTLHLVKKESAAVGPPQLLCALIGDFPFNDSLVQKTNELALFYQGFRRIRGDGNCYYRAVMFSFVEQVLSQAEPQRGELLNGFVATLRTLGGQESLIEYFGHYISEAKERLAVRDFLIDLLHRKPEFDLELISAAKALLMKFILEHRDFEANGMRLEEVMMSTRVTLEECCRECIEQMGECAEGAFVNLGLLFTILGCRGALVTLDKNDQPINIIFHESSSASLITVHLLFRPGHYDLLYPFATTTFQDLKHFRHSTSSPLCAPPAREPVSAPILGAHSAAGEIISSSSESCGQASGIEPVRFESSPDPNKVPVAESISKAAASDDSVKNIRLRSVWNSSMAKNPVFVAKSSLIEDLPAEKKMRVSADQFVEMLSNPSAKLKMPHNDVNVLEIDDLRLVIPSSHALVALNSPFAWPAANSTSSTASASGSASADSSICKGTVARKLCLLDLSKLESVQAAEAELSKHFDRKIHIVNTAVLQELYQRENRERWPPREIDVEEIANIQEEIKEIVQGPPQTVRLRSVWEPSMADNPVFIAKSSEIDDLPSPKKMKINIDKFPEMLSNPSEKLKMPRTDVNVLEIDDVRLVIPSSHALVVLNLPAAASVSADSSTGTVDRKFCLVDLSMLQNVQTVEEEFNKRFSRQLKIVNAAVFEELYQPVNRERSPPREIELKEIVQSIRVRMNYNGGRKVINVSSKMSFEVFWEKVITAFNLALDHASLSVMRGEDGQVVDATSFETCVNEALAYGDSKLTWHVMGCVSCQSRGRPLAMGSHPRFLSMSCNELLCESCVNEVYDALPIDSLYKVRRQEEDDPQLKQDLEAFCPCCKKRWTEADALESHRNVRDFDAAMQIKPVKFVSLACRVICGVEESVLEDAYQLGCDHFCCLDCVGGSIKAQVDTEKMKENPSKIVCPVCKEAQRIGEICWCSCMRCKPIDFDQKADSEIDSGMAHVITPEEMQGLLERGAIDENVLRSWEQLGVNMVAGMDRNSKKRHCRCGNIFITANNFDSRKLECPYGCGHEMCAKCGNDYHEGKCEHVGIPKEDFPRECERCGLVGLIPSDCMHITCECKHEFCFLCTAPHRPSVAHSTAYHRRGCSLFGELCCDKKCRENGANHCAEAKYLPGPCDACVSIGNHNSCQHSDWKACSGCVREKKLCNHICSECKRLGQSCDFPTDTKANGDAYEFFKLEAVIKRQKELEAEFMKP